MQSARYRKRYLIAIMAPPPFTKNTFAQMDMALSMQSQSSSGSHRMAIVALKAFGDLVIAVNCIERRSPAFREKIEILLGRHLCLLFEALETKIPAFVVDHGEANLPSLFTWKKDGSVKAMKSAVGL